MAASPIPAPEPDVPAPALAVRCLRRNADQRLRELETLLAQNITNKTYYDSLYQSAQPFVRVAPGRAVYLSLVFNFNK